MNRNAIDIDSAPIGSKYVGIDTIWEHETITKVSDDEICWERAYDKEVICEICKIMKNEFYYYFISENRSIIPISTKYYKQDA